MFKPSPTRKWNKEKNFSGMVNHYENYHYAQNKRNTNINLKNAPLVPVSALGIREQLHGVKGIQSYCKILR